MAARKKPAPPPWSIRVAAAHRAVGRPSTWTCSIGIWVTSSAGFRFGFFKTSSARWPAPICAPVQFSVLVVIGANSGLSQAEVCDGTGDRAGAAGPSIGRIGKTRFDRADRCGQ